jgi:hypothetical protein
VVVATSVRLFTPFIYLPKCIVQTLAVGVNLRACQTIESLRKLTSLHYSAAHTVVIKGVQIFQNNASVEYSDLDVMQMLGRAVSHGLSQTYVLFIF